MEDVKPNKNYPKTIGIIMDGNRRFARAKNLPVFKGHEAGYEKLKEFLGWVKKAGIETVIAYAFSTENWKRAKDEVGYLINLLERVVIDKAGELKKEKIKVKFIGQLERFPRNIQRAMEKLEHETSQYKTTLVIALSYGGRAEIIQAIKKIKNTNDISEDNFDKFLWTAGIPEPELIIRTSGEVRTSNFLIWQSAYSEWYFTKTLWPAFKKSEFIKILKDFTKREKRNGK